MHDIEILVHIKAVRSAISVYFMTSVIHCKANEGVMMLPMRLDKTADHTKYMVVHTKLRKGSCAFGAVFMHNTVIIAVVDNVKIMLITKEKFHRLEELLGKKEAADYKPLVRKIEDDFKALKKSDKG